MADMYISNRVLKAVLGLAATAIIGACSDAPTAPSTKSSALKPGGAQKLEACDPFAFTCDTGGGSDYVAPVDNRIYLRAFFVTNCDVSLDYRCSPYCDYYDYNCVLRTVDGGYYEIRQNLYEANGKWIGYNSQKWHGWAGTVNIPIFDTRMCAGSGRYMNVEIYDIGLGALQYLTRKASFNVYANNRDQTLLEGNINWVAHITWHWDPC
jgi:hypothetical protein